MKIDYLNHMGDDLTVVNAARVSFDKESDWERVTTAWESTNEILDTVLSERDTKLISYLARNNHWTPFGHPTITLRETVPIWIARQRMRSNVGFVYNEVSRRYVDDEPQFYTPVLYARVENLKQGSADVEVADALALRTEMERHWETSRLLYNKLLAAGVAPEQSRAVLPVSHYTSYYVTGSLAAWARIFKLRIGNHASKEMQWMAQEWGKIIEPLFPVSWRALNVES